MYPSKEEKSFHAIGNSFLAVFGFIGGVGTIFSLDKNTLGVWYYVIIVACFCVSVIFFIRILAYLIKNQKLLIRYLTYLIAPKHPLIIQKKECIYTFIDRTHMDYRKNFKIQSKISELYSFYDMYMWTKDYKKQHLVPMNSDTITVERSEDQWQFYCITFNQACGKNQIHETGVHMPSLYDPKKESQLFLSTGIFEPTISLSLCVVIKNGLKFKAGSTFCRIYNYYYGRAADCEIPLEIISIPQNEGGGYKLSYNTTYPIKNARYKLVWEFEGE